VPHGGNKMKAINFYVHEESAIPNLLKFLAIPRPDGQQQVVSILPKIEFTQKIIDTIKEVKNLFTLIQAILVVTLNYIYPGISLLHPIGAASCTKPKIINNYYKINFLLICRIVRA
jgi:hypothetical protein